MTVLPYITLSLISGLGKLTLEEVKSLALKVGLILVISWLLAFAVIVASPLAYPDWTSATFFSTSLIEKPPEVNFLQLYIPSNPFFSLANNIVPAVVVFSITVGVALIGVANKMTLIEPLTILSSALMKVTTAIAKLTPYGVFAIVASTAGTMGLEELGRLQVFLITYVVVALLLTFDITFFEELGDQYDGLVFSAEAGSAWSLLYPSYTVVVPQPRTVAILMAFPIAQGDLEMVSLINNWLALKKEDGTIEPFYDYWILGQDAVPVTPRWSVVRNVLHWVDER